MKCAVKRSIASSRVIKLIFIDPVLVVVTTQTISIERKYVSIKGRVVGAAPCGRDRVVLLSADGVLHLYDLNLVELVAVTVGLPGEWDSRDSAALTCSRSGDMVAFEQNDGSVCVYAISGLEITYIGRNYVTDPIIGCIISEGLSGAPGLLVIFMGNFAKIIEISPMMSTISSVRTAMDPILFILPLTQDGDCLMVSQKKVRIFPLKGVLVGGVDFKFMKLPGMVTAATSTLLKSGTIHNMIICSGRLYELVLLDGNIEVETIYKPNSLNSFSNVDAFFCIHGADLWLINWYGKGIRGKLIIDKDGHSKELDPENELDFDCTDFIVDSFSNSLLGFGKQSNVDIISKCVPMESFIEPAKSPYLCDLIYENQFKLLFVVYPLETCVFSVITDANGTTLRQIYTLEGQALAAGTYKDLCVCVLGDRLVPITQYTFKTLDAIQLNTHHARMATISKSHIIIGTTDNCIKSFSFDTLSPEPTTLIKADDKELITFIKVNNQNQLIYGTVASYIATYDLDSRTHNAKIPCDEGVPTDIAFSGDMCYTAFRGGTLAITDVKQNIKRVVQVNKEALKFSNCGDKVIARARGLWLLRGDTISPLVRAHGKAHDSFDKVMVAGACGLPYFDLSLMVAYNHELYMLCTSNLDALTSRPQVYSLHTKGVPFTILKSAKFRVWIAVAPNAISFYDMKHRTLLKLTSDLNSSEKLTAASLLEIEHNGSSYTHLVLATTRNLSEGHQYLIRSCSMKRDRQNFTITKRLKLEVDDPISILEPHGDLLLAASGGKILKVSIEKQTGLLSEQWLSLEGTINQVSVKGTFAYLSTTSGLIKLDLEQTKILTDVDNMVNRMRHCICHYAYQDGQLGDIVLCAQKDCFLNVFELSNMRWRALQRLDSTERIMRMYPVESASIPPGTAAVVALTTSGSFLEIRIGEGNVECGPYLY